LDKSTIRKEAAFDLAEILDAVIQNPTMKVPVPVEDKPQNTTYHYPKEEHNRLSLG
jgi:hypothetical protein